MPAAAEAPITPIKAEVVATPIVAAPSIRPDVKAWMDADTDEKKILAVKQFPALRQMFALAQNIKTS